MIELYQAEWCPYSSAVRERLTELGIDFVARQVAPWPEQRGALVDRVGVDSIPVLVVDGDVHVGSGEIFAFLDGLEVPPTAAEHRAQYHEHAPARHRDVTARLLERVAPVDSPA